MTQTKISLGQAIDQIIGALEGLDAESRKTAIDAACAQLKIQVASAAIGITATQAPLGQKRSSNDNQSTLSGTHPAASTDIRTFRAAKNPKSAREMACVVAFYLQELAPEGECKDSISAADLETYFKQANFKLPEKIRQVLPDSKGAGYFDTAARGAYKLNAVGYNLVAHKLPATSAGG